MVMKLIYSIKKEIPHHLYPPVFRTSTLDYDFTPSPLALNYITENLQALIYVCEEPEDLDKSLFKII